MTTGRIIGYSILGVVFLFYLIYTFRYARIFNRTTFFTGRRKTFHSIMIWLFPFCWIWILKSFFKPLAGSAEFQDKLDSSGYKESFGAGFWSGGTGTP